MSRRAAGKPPTKPKLTANQIREAKAVFESIDADNSGSVTVNELSTVLSQLGEEASLAPLIVAIWDENGDNRIGFNEFVNFYEVVESGGADQKKIFELLFKRLDKDKDGQLDAAEMRVFTELIGIPITAEEAAELVAQIDKDGSGTISFSELLVALDIE
jgi:Ca2+-binding EF-hand superfamily protein